MPVNPTDAPLKGVVFDIQRFCTDDGPGIRTTVFLKGCNLRCPWCHNPESFSRCPQLACDMDQCAHCGRCAAVCPTGAHAMDAGVHVWNRALCTACGRCAAACPAGALRLYGREVTGEEVMRTVLRDVRYYHASGGGVTLSGGEPLMQPAFALDVLSRCRAAGISTALESNGTMPLPLYVRTLALTDLYLIDYKVTDEREVALSPNAPVSYVTDTLRMLASRGARIWLRCPIIPGLNDSGAHFDAIRALRRQIQPERVEIMAYHDMGRLKWRTLGLPYSLNALQTVSEAQKKAWQAAVDA